METSHFEALLEHLTTVAPELLNACHWLALDPRVATSTLGDDARQHLVVDSSRLIHTLRAAPTEAAVASHALLNAHRHLLDEIKSSLELLIRARETEWSHPTEILGRPCPDFGHLLANCKARLERTNGERRRLLEAIREKLERATNLEAKARRRRGNRV